MILADSVLLKTPYAPASTCLVGTKFSTLKSDGLNDPIGPEEDNSTEVKYAVTFYGCIVQYHTVVLLRSSN
jgi:hypothetical protein